MLEVGASRVGLGDKNRVLSALGLILKRFVTIATESFSELSLSLSFFTRVAMRT